MKPKHYQKLLPNYSRKRAFHDHNWSQYSLIDEGFIGSKIYINPLSISEIDLYLKDRDSHLSRFPSTIGTRVEYTPHIGEDGAKIMQMKILYHPSMKAEVEAAIGALNLIYA